MAQHRFPRAKRQELAAAFAYAREHPVYRRFAPPDDSLRLDIVALHIIDDEIAKRREEERKHGRKSNLAFLTGTTIRDLFGHKKTKRKLSPEAEKRAREIEDLIKAYEGLMMKMFSNRSRGAAATGGVGAEVDHPMEASGHFRLT